MNKTNVDTGTDDLTGWIVDEHLAVLSFNRPTRRNALSPEIYDGFVNVLPPLAANPNIRVLMLTGAGGAFCAGGDVKAMNERNKASANNAGLSNAASEGRVDDLRARQRQLSLALHEFPQPVVAALPGPAAGAGFSIAMAADLRLASESALLVTAFAGVGASGDFGGSWFLNRLVGPAKAKELYFMSPRLSAQESLALGLVNRVLPDEDFEAAAIAFCVELAQRAPIALRYMKENINRADTTSLAEALEAEAVAMVRTMTTDDHKEAAAAFVEKRDPKFIGS